ncbi:MAG: ACR3 family arsenite efflux transporter [Burkholderiales bacterium]|nr:ACR3 family arsenite efflux transporter [Burkholderiales bacterium]
MSEAGTAGAAAGTAPLSGFERWLTVWVFACIAAGILLGRMFPEPVRWLANLEVARVNLPVGLLVWAMIVPMLTRIDFAAIGAVREHWRGIAVTLAVNWALKPLAMAVLAWVFVRHLFSAWLPAAEQDAYVAGLILLAAAPCTAMVFVWSEIVRGDPAFTLTQVALNDTIMVFAFAPIVALLLGVSSVTVPWSTLLASVVVYIVVPLAFAQAVRAKLLARSRDELDRALAAMKPVSTAALLATLVLLFAFQGEAILAQPWIIAMLAVPIAVQVALSSSVAYAANRRLGVAHAAAGPSALIGASNFFELAVAAAIGLFGLGSGAALATVVGVLVEVPLMLAVAALVVRSRAWYERGAIRSRAPAR